MGVPPFLKGWKREGKLFFLSPFLKGLIGGGGGGAQGK